MNMNQTPILLFLDFDGVLHPLHSPVDKQLEKIFFFESTIRQYPNINIVISSSWRHNYTMDELLAYFAVDIQRRIIDSTRHVEVSKAKNRYDEILDYLKHTNQLQSLWIAIDDSKKEFPENLSNVVFCKPNVGFNEESANALKEIIKHMTPSP